MKVTFVPINGSHEHFVLIDFGHVLYQFWSREAVQPDRFWVWSRTPLHKWQELGIGTEEECVRLLEQKVALYG